MKKRFMAALSVLALALALAHTTYGACGIKVWIYKGDIMAHDPMAQDKKLSEQK